jgi:hypothetical protein
LTPAPAEPAQPNYFLLWLIPGLIAVALVGAIRGTETGATVTTSQAQGTEVLEATTEAGLAPITPAQSQPEAPIASPTPTPFSTGTFTYAAGNSEPVGTAPFRTYAVAVENGSGVDINLLTAFVDSTLADPRSWIGDQSTGFMRVEDPDDATAFVLVVATPDTVDGLCAPLKTQGQYSCDNNGWIALNLDRWTGATPTWPSDLATYRRYLVNHEVGHDILGPTHPKCPAVGEPAPIMMQQTVSLDGCRPNGWVYPN